jgi:hypothetical protein
VWSLGIDDVAGRLQGLIDGVIDSSNTNHLQLDRAESNEPSNPKNPNEIRLPSMSSKTVAVIFLLIAVAVVGFGYFSNYLAQKSTIISASQGINSVASVFGLNRR